MSNFGFNRDVSLEDFRPLAIAHRDIISGNSNSYSFTDGQTSQIIEVLGRDFLYNEQGVYGGIPTIVVDLRNGYGQSISQLFNGDDIQSYLDLDFGDQIEFALRNDDIVFASAGNNTLMSGSGDDVVSGGTDRDLIFAGRGDDFASGGQGEDTIYGGQDSDALFGNAGNDVLFGNLGSDSLYGGQGNDSLFGGQGDDLLTGDLGDNYLSGDLGNDILVGGQGDEVLTGGAGADRYVIGQNSGQDHVLGFSQAEGDRIDLQGQSYALVSRDDGSAQLNLSGGGQVILAGIVAGQVDQGYLV